MKTNKQNKNTKAETPGLMNRIAQSSSEAFRAVFFRGPESTRNKDGDEIPVWNVFLGDEHGEPVRTVYGIYDFKRAESLAKVMSSDRKLELIHEAQPAA
ncbi:MAG: hypothetical protein ACXWDN_08390 [Limisphaerales bacterium]